MGRAKKIAIVLTGCTCIVLILLVGAILLTPLLVNKTEIAGKIRSEVSTLVGGDFDFERIDLSIFPFPHALVVSPQVKIPGRLSLSAKNVAVYPDVFSILKGSFTLDEAIINEPQTTIWVAGSSANRKNEPPDTDINQLLPHLFKELSRLPAVSLPVANATVSQGSVTLMYDRNKKITFDTLNGALQNEAGTVALQFTGSSSLFASLAVSGTLQRRPLNGKLQVTLGKINLVHMSDSFFPKAILTAGAGEADVAIDIDLENNEKIIVNVKGSAPNVRLLQAKQPVTVDLKKLSGSMVVNPASTTITLSEMSFGNPSIDLSGSFRMSETPPKLDLQIKTGVLDIESTRSLAQSLAGSNSVVKTIFDILQKGTIATLALSSRADTLGGLTDLENLSLAAHLDKGDVVVPGAELTLSEVSGDVAMSKGILSGEKVAADWQRSTIQNGTFTIDLTKDPLPIQVNSALAVNVGDLPTILEKFIHDKAFNDELSQIEGLEGSTSGIVALTGDTEQLKVAVSASDVNVSLRHQKLPFPLHITEGSISYDGDAIGWKHLKGSLGKSTFGLFTGNVDIGKPQTVTIESGTAQIIIPDLLTWLSSNENLRVFTDHYAGGTAVLKVSEIKAHGPLRDAGKLTYELSGDLTDLSIKDKANQPESFHIKSLDFKVDPNTFDISDSTLSMLDGSLKLSGKYLNYMEKEKGVISLDFYGSLGEQTMGWVKENAHLPPWMILRPLVFRKSHVTYSHHDKQQISATLRLQEKLELAADVSVTGDSVDVKHLKVKDIHSQAQLSVKKAKQRVELSFDGSLHESTLNQVMQLDPKLNGLLDGKAGLTFSLDNPFTLRLSGELEGENLSIPDILGGPLEVHTLSVSGVSDKLILNSAQLSWSDTTVSVTGTARPVGSRLVDVDLTVEADAIDVDDIMKKIEGQKKVPDKKSVNGYSLPIEGLIHLKADRFKARNYTIEPLQADIRFQKNSGAITLKESKLCGIATTGIITVSPAGISFHLEPEANNQALNAALSCFVDDHFRADGTINATGVLKGQGAVSDLVRSTKGQLEIRIADGHIYHDILLLNVLKFLNLSQVLTARVSVDEMAAKGVGFKNIETALELKDGVLEYTKIVVDANEIQLSGIGMIDLESKQVDFKILAAPLVTANSVLGYIPLIGGVLKTLTAIPLRLSGNIDSVHVLPLAPSAIGNELKEAMKQLSDVPLNIVHVNKFLERAGKNDK